jgi:hypothetical protein
LEEWLRVGGDRDHIGGVEAVGQCGSSGRRQLPHAGTERSELGDRTRNSVTVEVEAESTEERGKFLGRPEGEAQGLEEAPELDEQSFDRACHSSRPAPGRFAQLYAVRAESSSTTIRRRPRACHHEQSIEKAKV